MQQSEVEWLRAKQRKVGGRCWAAFGNALLEFASLQENFLDAAATAFSIFLLEASALPHDETGTASNLGAVPAK